ncbi:MAG: TlpA family protein disulfide reductase [Chloroflexi bacterium]|nr:TlpA family protein disulfide reductase [Chloroflexota bacterium]
MKGLIAFVALLLAGMLLAACNGPPPLSTPVPAIESESTAIEPAPVVVLTTPTPTNTRAVPSLPDSRSVFIDANRVARVDEPAPDFQMPLFDGGVINLSDYRGDVVVLNFWASWCGPCRWEMPAFERMYQEYGDKGVMFVGVAISDDPANAQAFADEVGVTYPIGADFAGRIARVYRPTTMPTTFFIDREGVIRRRLVSVANEGALRIFLRGLIAQ